MSNVLDFSKVHDFSDLESSYRFSCMGNTYSIPPISKRKAVELFEISKKAGEATENKDSTNMDFQDEFILASVKKEIVDADTSIVLQDLTSEEIQDWPIQLQIKIVGVITQLISADIAKEKKE